MTAAAVLEATKYLTFRLEDEIYGMDIAKVREVLDFTVVTKVPRTPDFMRGVINLRGNVVPVVDLRLKFRMTGTVQTVNTCIIIVEVRVDGERTLLGVLADSVQEVLDLGQERLEPAPKIGTRLNTEFIKGMGKLKDRLIIVLDIDNVFSIRHMVSEEPAESKDVN